MPRSTTYIIGGARSGTTMFGQVMNSHRGVLAFPEVFHTGSWGAEWNYWMWLKDRVDQDPAWLLPEGPRRARLFEEYLEFLRSYRQAYAPGRDALMVDVKYDQLHLINPWQSPLDPPFLVKMVRRHDWGVIHIVRRNVLAVLVSSLVASARKREGRLEYDSPYLGKITLPTDNLVPILEKLQRHPALLETWLDGHPKVLKIFYEDMVSRGRMDDAVLERVADFLGISNAFAGNPPTVKVSPPLHEAIENLDEVRRHLDGTPFLAMLDGPGG